MINFLVKSMWKLFLMFIMSQTELTKNSFPSNIWRNSETRAERCGFFYTVIHTCTQFFPLCCNESSGKIELLSGSCFWDTDFCVANRCWVASKETMIVVFVFVKLFCWKSCENSITRIRVYIERNVKCSVYTSHSNTSIGHRNTLFWRKKIVWLDSFKIEVIVYKKGLREIVFLLLGISPVNSEED